MKVSSILVAAGLFAVVQAQSQCAGVAASVPTCATSCIQSAASKVGCAINDYVCQCGAASSSAINSVAFGCVLASCGPTTGLAVQTSAAAVCACASSVGGSGSAAPSSAAPASSAVPASSAATASSGPSSAGSSATVASVAATTGSASAGSSATVPSSTGGASVASMASSAAPAGSSAASSHSGAASFTDAGIQVFMSVGAGVAVFLGLMAAL